MTADELHQVMFGFTRVRHTPSGAVGTVVDAPEDIRLRASANLIVLVEGEGLLSMPSKDLEVAR